MRILGGITILLFSNFCLAVGWEEVSKQTARELNIEVKIEIDDQNQCHKVTAILPAEIEFSELGKRELWGLRYQEVENKDKGWQLMPKGTYIELSIVPDGVHKKVDALCLSNDDLDSAHLSATYGGPPGTPPMVMILNLSDFR